VVGALSSETDRDLLGLSKHNMRKTLYLLISSGDEIVLSCDTQLLVAALNASIDNVTKTNPARAELMDQMAKMQRSLQEEKDCELMEQKHGYLRDVVLALFDAGDAQINRGSRV
jgi:hypothetical protein